MQLVVLTAFTLVAFASNSLFCRMALGGDLIDPISFTTIRLTSGALFLVAISKWASRKRQVSSADGSWISGLALFVYATAFSLAYVSVDTGMGALILFGAVQATMISIGLINGERPRLVQCVGFFAALGGFFYLFSPGITSPHPGGAAMMLASGVAWGVYSVRGKGAVNPIAITAGNFWKAALPAICCSVFAFSRIDIQPTGAALAVVSGMFTSGLGYILWYTVLKSLSTTRAAILQLLVPLIAAILGVVFLSEILTLRLVLSGALILGGVALAVLSEANQGKGDI